MIRIVKPADPPAVLKDRGADGIRELCEEYDRDPPAYQSGAKKLTIKSAIYGHASVVEALKAAQHRKCCFCERKLLGDVEHFRPKNAFQQSSADPLSKLGYYWLAYLWENLFLACGPCNQRFKRSLFPLENAAARATSHHDDLEAERPLLLHPSIDDPAAHIGFREEIAFPIQGSTRGQACIDILGLNHSEVAESRRGYLNILRNLKDMRTALSSEIKLRSTAGLDVPIELTERLMRVDEALSSAARNDAEYSSMVRFALAVG